MSNKISVAGNLTKDAEVWSGGKLTGVKFGLADNVGFGDRASTNFFNVSIVKDNPQKLCDMLKKGKAVICYGTFKARPYRTKNNEEKISLDLEVNQFDLHFQQGSSDGGGAPRSAPQNQAPAASSPPPAAPPAATPETDDDMPF